MNKPRMATKRSSPEKGRLKREIFSRWPWISCAAVALVVGGLLFADWWICLPDDVVATYVGRQSCIECHAQEVQDWTGSFHDLAMDRATPETVLGDFNDVEFTHHGITSRLYRDGEKYMVRTEGPDGQMDDFEVKYTFGVEPLQQYMVEFGRTDDMGENELPRVQVLRICWDTEKQCWFYLPPPDVPERLSPDDELHWTGIAQRWNTMCADCHSTNLQKNYDPVSNAYRTTFSEIDVSCEACHGPASVHIELARQRSFFWDRKRGYGLARLKEPDPLVEIQTCAPCHARRSVIYPGAKPGDNFYDHYANELLLAQTYYADGQIMDEDYVYGSFIQSKMYHKGIRCTDCHDPHKAKPRYQDNAVCTTCHQHPAGKYDVVAHHRHEAGSEGALCVECHMPETTYMEVDPRRDHSIRIPRPDLSVRIGTPNACSRCHLDEGKLDPKRAAELEEYQDWLIAARNGDEQVREALERVDQWCAEKFVEWYGEKEDVETHFANTLEAARRGDPDVENDLIEVARDRQLPGIVRATAVMEMGRFASQRVVDASSELIRDGDPQVRATAIEHLRALPQQELARVVGPLLLDPRRYVRLEAARAMASLPESALRGTLRRARETAIDELVRGILVNNDRAAAHLNLGVLYETLQDFDQARRAYEMAIHVQPGVTGPRSNLAALLERLADEQRQRAEYLAQHGSREAAQRAMEQSSEYRQRVAQLRQEELQLLGRDVRLAPENAAIHYRYGLLLYLHDRFEEAETHLEEACRLEPNTPDFVLALALFLQQQQRFEDAYQWARRLVTLRPDDPSYRQLLLQLRQQAADSASKASS